MIKAYQNKEISFKNVKSYNLDEYVGLPLEHPETYYNFMHTNLFNHVDMLEENIHVPHAEKENMGLTTWKEAPEGMIYKYDVTIAKNYLTENEMNKSSLSNESENSKLASQFVAWAFKDNYSKKNR